MDSTIETLEIIIKARIDDALKNIKAITDEVKSKVSESASSMKKITKSSQEVADTLKPIVQETKSSMKQYEDTVKNAVTNVNKKLESTKSKTIDLNFNVDDMEYVVLKQKLQEIKSIRDEMLSGHDDLIFSDEENQRLDDIVSKIFEINTALQHKQVMGNSNWFQEQNSGPMEPTIPSVFDKEIKVTANTEEAKDNLNSMKIYSTNIFGDIRHIFGNIGNIIGQSIKKGVNLAKKSLMGIKNTINKVKEYFNSLKNKTNDTFSKGINSIKRFALGLLSIRTAISAVSKAAQAYLSFDSQLSDSIQNSWNTLGSLLAPILEYVAGLFSKVTSAVATFVKALTGIDLVAKANAKALDKQSKSAKNANKQTASIDDISILSSEKSGGSETFSPITTEEINISIFDDILSRIREITAAWINGDWGRVAELISKSFVDLFNWISEKIKEIDFSAIGENISEFFTGIDFSGILTGLTEIFGEALLGFQDMWLAIDWATILSNLGDGIRDSIFFASDYISQIEWGTIGQRLSEAFVSIDWGGIGSSILTFLWSKLSGILQLFLGIDWSSVGKKISDSVHEWITTIITKFQETDWLQLGMDIANAIMDFILSIDWGQLGIDILTGLAEGLMATIEFVLGAFSQLLDRILEFFGIHSPSTVFSDMGKNMILGLIEGIRSLKDKVLSIFSDIWSGIKEVFSKTASFFQNTFQNAWQKVKDVFSAGGRIFDGIKDGIVSSFKNIVNVIIRGINKVVKIPFEGINTALRKIKGIEILGYKPFDWISTINVPQIPELATGNVAYEKTLAIFGEYSNAKNNPEITAPQSILKQTMTDALNEYAFNNNTGANHITVQFGVEKVIDEIIDEINKRISRRGVSVFREA